jgi:hypothetical protein
MKVQFTASSLIRNKKLNVCFEKTATRLRIRGRCHMQGDSGQPGLKGGRQQKNNRKNGDRGGEAQWVTGHHHPPAAVAPC